MLGHLAVYLHTLRLDESAETWVEIETPAQFAAQVARAVRQGRFLRVVLPRAVHPQRIDSGAGGEDQSGRLLTSAAH